MYFKIGSHTDTLIGVRLIRGKTQGPGIIVGIVKDNKLMHVASKGMANLDYNIPIDTKSNFRLSSTSKQFTAACILHLVEANQLKLTDPLSGFFPEFSTTIGKVTVQNLLNHTSGIRDYMTLMMIQESRQMDFLNSFIGEDRDIMGLLVKQNDLSFKSGTKHSYSNTNYWILAKLVERVSKQSIGAYAKEHFFKPLKMKATSFLESKGQLVQNRVSGYVSECAECDRLEYRAYSDAVGDGGVVSSITDLFLWEKEFHNQKVISKKIWEMMLRKGKLENGETISYAAGLILDEYNGEKLVKHSGQIPGFSSEIFRFPDHDISIIVLGNQNWHNVNKIAKEVAAFFFPVKNKNEIAIPSSAIASATLTIDELNNFCGNYYYKETKEYRTIERKENELIYVRNNGPNSKLIPLSKNSLTFEDRPHIILNFTFNSDGTKHILWQDAKGNQHADSYIKEKIMANELRVYASLYRSNELDKDIEIGFENDMLVIDFFDRRLPLDFIKKDEFLAMGMFKFRFERDSTNNILSLRMDAPRATNIHFKKINI